MIIKILRLDHDEESNYNEKSHLWSFATASAAVTVVVAL